MAGALLFRDDHIHKKVKVLSGGERARLCMAGLLLGTANVLVLDHFTDNINLNVRRNGDVHDLDILVRKQFLISVVDVADFVTLGNCLSILRHAGCNRDGVEADIPIRHQLAIGHDET